MKKRKFSNQELSLFCREIALLLRTGVSTATALELLVEQEEDQEWKMVLTATLTEMEEGLSFYEALAKTEYFPVYLIGLLKMGDYAGRLEESFLALADYYEKQQRIQERVKEALLYPSVLLLIMSVVIVFLLTQVMPIFQSVYANLGTQMTGLAGVLLKMGLFLQQILPILAVIFVLIIIVVLIFLSSATVSQKVVTYLQKQMADTGIMRSIHDAWIAEAVAMGMQSGLPLEEALELASGVVADIPAANTRLKQCIAELENGEALGDALQKAEVFPVTYCQLIRLGMKAGNGDEMMTEVAELLTEEAERKISTRIGLLEPTLVLVASILIGAILLSVMLPLINIMEMIG